MPVENLWPVYIFQYFKEKQHPLNTAIIAKLGLKQSEIIRSNEANFDQQCEAIIKQQPLLIYPGEDSIPIETLLDESAITEKPRPILFLDGTWRKTRLLIHESPQIAQLQKISIKPKLRSRYKIRKAPNPDAISTLEAIVYVLSRLEHEPDKYHSLLETMDIMINKQIEMMGEETFSKNYKE